jgi:hypothetical protein
MLAFAFSLLYCFKNRSAHSRCIGLTPLGQWLVVKVHILAQILAEVPKKARNLLSLMLGVTEEERLLTREAATRIKVSAVTPEALVRTGMARSGVVR